jgi:isopenicillin N synthase-like dioxygenase
VEGLQTRTRGLDRNKLGAKRLDFDSIPMIDIAALINGDKAARAEVACMIGEVCCNVGFFYVTNHGVAQSLIDAVWREADAFFSLPQEEKLKYDIHNIKRHRGFVPIGGLNADPENTGAVDMHEGYEVSLELPADDPDYLAGHVMYGPNVWPDNPPGYRAAVYDYYEAVLGLGHALFRGFAVALDLEENFFEDKIDKPMAQLRLLYYPPREGPPDAMRLGVGAHTDYECFTILAMTDPGLQVMNVAGEWIEAPPIPGAFVINIGDTLALWSNDRFVSTVHRVISPKGRKRFSLPFFFGLNHDTVVSCLETCQGPDRPPRHEPILAGDLTVANITAAYTYLP